MTVQGRRYSREGTMKNYNTKGKDIIMAYLKDHADGNFSANDILQYLEEHNSKMNISTVYRNLDKFVDQGMLMKLKNPDDDFCRYQYKHPDGNCDDHIHMQCRNCGRVFHLECGFMEELSKHLSAHHGFTIESAGSMIKGLCGECNTDVSFEAEHLHEAEHSQEAEHLHEAEHSQEAAHLHEAEHPQETVHPHEIEKKSFSIITEELQDIQLDPLQEPIIKRCIHTSADFDYVENLCFSDHAVEKLHAAIKNGACIVTDTQMAKAGINSTERAKYGGEVFCFMRDSDVAAAAKKRGCTRAVVSMEKAATLGKPLIFAIGNAPTALLCLYDLIQKGKLNPEGIIGVPVGFVNVVEAKEQIMRADIPYIVARGRKGGSNVAAAICNALLYQLRDMENH